MLEESGDTAFKKSFRHFAEILNPLFDPKPHMAVDRLFEFVCALVRAGGALDQGWDPLYESMSTLDDLAGLAKLNLPAEQFPDPVRTRARLALLSYCHLTEMDLPYTIVANLLRLRIGKNYDDDPFRGLIVIPKRKNAKVLFPTPGKKINQIKKFALEATLPLVGEAFEAIYDKVIRNAVYHSDYTLEAGEFRFLKAYRFSKKAGCSLQSVSWDELAELVTNTFAFYKALFALYDRCSKSFGSFKDAFLPYDFFLKGILQLIFDEEDRLIGFRTYWPNGSLSEYSRTKNGSVGNNLAFNPDGSINFMVGEYASKPGSFSKLVEQDMRAAYAVVPGTSLRPYWPEKIAAYKLYLNGC
jgi:hypothetical protein